MHNLLQFNDLEMLYFWCVEEFLIDLTSVCAVTVDASERIHHYYSGGIISYILARTVTKGHFQAEGAVYYSRIGRRTSQILCSYRVRKT